MSKNLYGGDDKMYKKIHFILIGFILIICYSVYNISTEHKNHYNSYDDISTLYVNYNNKYDPNIMTESGREKLVNNLNVQSSYVTKALYNDFMYIGNAVIFNFEDTDGTDISVIVDAEGSSSRFKMSVNFFKPGLEYILFLNTYDTFSIGTDNFFDINNDMDRNRKYYSLVVEDDISKVAVGSNYNFYCISKSCGSGNLTWGEIRHIDYITRNDDITQEHYTEYSLLVQQKYEDGAFND